MLKTIRKIPKFPRSDIYSYKYGKNELKIDVGEHGVTIWLNSRWVFDASCISEDGTIQIDKERMNKTKGRFNKTHAYYQIKSKEKLE